MSCRLAIAFGLVALTLSAGLAQPPARAPAAGTTLYHTDPKHPWNRLHETLFVRVGPDGVTYGQDRLEPLLWNESNYLLDGPARDLAATRLEAIPRSFLWIPDPVKRAVLQRDLWLVYNWLARDGKPKDERLARALAKAIKRLALTDAEIRDLPDNYAAAVKADAPHLPPDLFRADGPWVSVGRTDGVTAPAHLAEGGTNAFTNSVFLTFLRLPAGRAATVAFLKEATGFAEPLFVPGDGGGLVPNPKLPQFPRGTELALVRRALLIDAAGRVAASPLTESVQRRTITADPGPLTKQALDDARLHTPGGVRRIGAAQRFQEFRLTRQGLFAGRAGGLQAVADDERDLKTGFGAHPWDEFDRAREQNAKFAAGRQLQGIRESCTFCHGLPGVYSFNSLQDFRGGLSRDGEKLRPHPLTERSVAEVSAAAVKRKEGTATWESLRKMMTE